VQNPAGGRESDSLSPVAILGVIMYQGFQSYVPQSSYSNNPFLLYLLQQLFGLKEPSPVPPPTRPPSASHELLDPKNFERMPASPSFGTPRLATVEEQAREPWRYPAGQVPYYGGGCFGVPSWEKEASKEYFSKLTPPQLESWQKNAASMILTGYPDPSYKPGPNEKFLYKTGVPPANLTNY